MIRTIIVKCHCEHSYGKNSTLKILDLILENNYDDNEVFVKIFRIKQKNIKSCNQFPQMWGSIWVSFWETMKKVFQLMTKRYSDMKKCA